MVPINRYKYLPILKRKNLQKSVSSLGGTREAFGCDEDSLSTVDKPQLCNGFDFDAWIPSKASSYLKLTLPSRRQLQPRYKKARESMGLSDGSLAAV